ncbi:MAG: transcription-repair coupling factor [Gammaproteobacteria bacterium]|nr:transcription-repair coupling factor [Gammaproteobacteria bacterium]
MTDPGRQSPLAPPRPERPGQQLAWGHLPPTAAVLALVEAAREHDGPLVVITPDTPALDRVADTARFFAGADGPGILGLPDWETLPYDLFSPHQDIVSERLATLYRLPELRRGLLLLPVSTVMQRLPPRDYVTGNVLMLDRGERLDIETFRHRLVEAGYRHVAQVMEHGEFAVRGALLDLFPMGGESPLRVDLFDDEIESIRAFDPETQRSGAEVERLRLLPAREFPLTEAGIARFRQAWRVRFEGDPGRCPVYRDVGQGLAPGGIEYYLPLFFERTATLFDYLPENALFVRLEGSADAATAFWEQIAARHAQRDHDAERPVLAPGELYLDPEIVNASLKRAPRIEVQVAETPLSRARGGVNFDASGLPPVAVQPRAPEPAATLRRFLDGFDGRVLFTAESAGRREVLSDLLRGWSIQHRSVDGWAEFLADDAAIALTVAPLDQGVVIASPSLAVISEAQLLGERAPQQRRRRRKGSDPDQVVRNLTELQHGAPVIHEEHGIGRYLGLQALDVAGVETEFLTLEYADGDRLYVPVASLGLISRYTGAEPDKAPLHKLGSGQWERIRRKAAQQVRDVAAELLDVYARRAAREGHAFRIDQADYRAFCAGFPFEETADQAGAIEAVIEDMQAGRPMDRVVCGDVGFGKTEVAMRAAFVAVQGGRQVAVLVPTTLLAEQHEQNFRDRFADWPVRIEALSRFRSAKEQKTILADLADGKVDIVIGTHRLLQGDVSFADVGLVIVDEEHRFGVRHKERIKALRAEVDMLTLTATPIPRTLNLSLSGLRDLSLIMTPPSERLAIKTFVNRWDPALIAEAIQRELKRGGQVYFLHNHVESIGKTAAEVEKIVPGTTVRIAHGQMPERELEQVMLDFYHRRFQVLVCTTIIESGIDVPSANTIIIDRADRLGLAQLHQLRGRVGRSHHRAYAYLVVPERKAMTADALKRLEAIASLEALGAGFLLATHDLEIRGAGELLGEDQSGQIEQVGFTLYMEMLERAVQALKSGRVPELDRPLHHGPEVDLRVPALLPEDYLPDVNLRLIFYKRISAAEDAEALRDLQVEMIDRFGLLPEPTRNLFRLAELKQRAAPLGIRRIEAGEEHGQLLFDDAPAIDPARLVDLVQREARTFRLVDGQRLRFTTPMPTVEARVAAVDGLLERLRPERAA